MNEPIVLGVELGGTKCLAVRAQGRVILDRRRLPTTTPEQVLPALAGVLAEWHRQTPAAAVGIASFGPLALDAGAAGHGRMLATPKPGWSGADILGGIAVGLELPSAIDTDVNAAALAEARWGAGRGVADFVYLTLGTGVGGGIVAGGRLVGGAGHPELGHVRLARRPGDDFAGVCPFHGDCIEGLVSGPAIAARAGAAGEALGDDHPVWDYVAHDLGALVAMLMLTVAPQRILLGGGVPMARPALVGKAAAAAAVQLAGYLPGSDPAAVVALPDLGGDAGPLGAVALALAACGS